MLQTIITYFHIQLVMFYNIIIQSLFGVYARLNVMDGIKNVFQTKFTIRSNDKFDENTKVILSNHKTFADYFIDGYVIGPNVCYLSRMMVAIAIPFTSLYALFTKMIYFFNRFSTNKNKMNDIIRYICKNRILLLYPEGTRNPTNNIIPLKRGCLQCIYNQNLQVQIMNISNKEKVFNEKSVSFTKNVECNIQISFSIIPSEYNTFELFYEKVCNEWNKLWENNKNTVIFIPKEEDYIYTKYSYLFFPSLCGLIALYDLQIFIYFIHVFYIGLIVCWNNISRIEKKQIETFITIYNNLQILLSGIMSIIGLYIFSTNLDNPLLLNNYEPNTIIQNFLLLHAFSKIFDFMDTIILIVTNKPFTILHTYHHITIGLVWFYVRNCNTNSVYFGAMLNSIVHILMYSYYNYSNLLKPFKSYITSIQLCQFVLCIIHAIIFYLYSSEKYIYYAYFQILYQVSMIILFSNFYYNTYLIKKIGDNKINSENLRKLFTKEDKYNFHKTIGLLSIIHFIVSTIPLSNYNLLPFSIKCIGISIPVILGFSSFKFRIGIERNLTYTIYRELQLHNIIFTLRHVSSWFLTEFIPNDKLFKFFSCLFFHIIADYITKYYAPSSKETLIRRYNGDNGDNKVFPMHKEIANRFMSISQFLATIVAIFSPYSSDNIASIFGIQIGAFSATLVRKQIVNNKVGAIIYIVSLIIAQIVCKNINSHTIILLFIAIVLRMIMNINKYLMWSIIFMYDHYITK